MEEGEGEEVVEEEEELNLGRLQVLFVYNTEHETIRNNTTQQ